MISPEIPIITKVNLIPSHDFKRSAESIGYNNMERDNILAVLLKTGGPEIATTLAKLFQAVITLFTKTKQNKFNQEMYWPINLLSIISKVMDGVMNCTLMWH